MSLSLVKTSRLTAASSSDDAPFWILRHHSPASITALAFVKGTHSPSSLRRTSSASSSSSASEANTTSSDEECRASTSSSSSSAPRKTTLPEQSRYLLVGDADGKVSLVDLASYRAVAHWQAHKAGTSILGLESWPYDEEADESKRRAGRRSRAKVRVVTHGRDNTLKTWSLALPSASALGKTRDGPLAEPKLLHTLQVNALNFCRFSLSPGEVGRGKSRETGAEAHGCVVGEEEGEALLAVPHTLDSGYIDIYHLPSYARLHTSIGSSSSSASASRKVGGVTRAPIVMAMHLFRLRARPGTDLEDRTGEPGAVREEKRSDRGRLALLAGYEDGSLVLWTQSSDAGDKKVRGQWQENWRAKSHRESILTLSILRSNVSAGYGRYFLSAGVDDRVVLGRVDLCAGAGTASASFVQVQILHTYTIPNARGGKAASAFLPLATGPQGQEGGDGEEDEVRFVLGAWDGRGKVYSYTLLPLAPSESTSSAPSSASAPVREGEGIACTRTLRYHKEGVQAVAAASLASEGVGASPGDALIALGGKEGRVTLWRG